MFFDAMRKGAIANLPVGLSVSAYGSILGMLASQKGISWVELLLMNVSIFAGSAQFVMIELWAPPLPIIEMTLAVLVINMRYLLIGASLNPVFQGKSFFHKALIMHVVADEDWAVTMAAHRNGGTTTGFLLGGGLFLGFIWSFGTLLGHRLGAVIQNPKLYALDFAFIAVFTALTVGMWRGKKDLLPFLSAALFAIVCEKFIPGKWYILAGGIGGAAVAVCQEKLKESRPILILETAFSKLKQIIFRTYSNQ